MVVFFNRQHCFRLPRLTEFGCYRSISMTSGMKPQLPFFVDRSESCVDLVVINKFNSHAMRVGQPAGERSPVHNRGRRRQAQLRSRFRGIPSPMAHNLPLSKVPMQSVTKRRSGFHHQVGTCKMAFCGDPTSWTKKNLHSTKSLARSALLVKPNVDRGGMTMYQEVDVLIFETNIYVQKG